MQDHTQRDTQPGPWVFNFIGKIQETGGIGLFDLVSKDRELSNNMVALSIAKALDQLKPKDKRFLSTKEAANKCNLSMSTMNKFRLYGGGPPFSKPSHGKILYSEEILDAWIAARTLKFNSRV